MYSIIATILSLPFTISTAFAVETVTPELPMQPAHTPGQQIIGTTQNAPITSQVTFASPFGNKTITDVLNGIANYAVIVSAPLATAMIIYGAFQILAARGVAAQVQAGKKTITYALGGLVIVIIARLLVSIVSGIAKGLV